MDELRRIVLDVLKPHEPSLLEFTRRVARMETVGSISSSLIELDQEVQNVRLTLEGEDLDFEAVEDVIEGLGGTIHSVDQVVCGERVVEERPTPQDGW
ncbi:DUF211 domain-containing protein [Halobacteriales archaeon Cl-PHB]